MKTKLAIAAALLVVGFSASASADETGHPGGLGLGRFHGYNAGANAL